MTGLHERRCIAATATAIVLLLGACANDPLRDSLHPTAADAANTPEPPPPGTIAALTRVGESVRLAGDPATAVDFFRRAHALDKFQPEPLIKLGLALNDLGAHNDAAEAFRQALVAAPHSAEAMRGLGIALIGLNQPALALDQLNASAAIAPDYRTFNAQGVAYDRMGAHAKAQESYDAGLKLAPNSLSLLNNLGLSLALGGDMNRAIDVLKSAAADPAASPRLRQNLALVYGLAGRDDDALKMSRVDLAPAEAERNVAYYRILRSASKEDVRLAVLGVATPRQQGNYVASTIPGSRRVVDNAAGDATKTAQDVTSPSDDRETPSVSTASGPESPPPS
ncbi:MAG: tetratricopeptide repeat protein, partial [Alphaproteobacteria bacterium]